MNACEAHLFHVNDAEIHIVILHQFNLVSVADSFCFELQCRRIKLNKDALF